MKKFNMIDEEFICENCKKRVNKLNYTARDHCPYCLCSKHVDINPGDRSNTCGGLLIPVGVINDNKNGYKIIYKCTLCGTIKNNKSAIDDDMDEIIRISVHD